MRSRLAVALLVLAAIAITGALVHRSAKPSAAPDDDHHEAQAGSEQDRHAARPAPGRAPDRRPRQRPDPPRRPPPADALALPDGCRQGEGTPSRLRRRHLRRAGRQGARHKRRGEPRHPLDRHQDPCGDQPLRPCRVCGGARRACSTRPTTPTSCRTERRPSRTPTTAASSSSAGIGSSARSVAPAVCAHDPPRTLGGVNGDTPLPGGGVLVSEVSGSWIDRFSRTGRLLWSFRAPVSYPSDPQPLPGGRILLADYASPGAAVILDHHGRVLWRYGPASGWGALDHPSLAIMLPNGNIAINDDYNDRVVVVDPRAAAHRLAVRPPRAAGPRRDVSPDSGRDGLHPARRPREASVAARTSPLTSVPGYGCILVP